MTIQPTNVTVLRQIAWELMQIMDNENHRPRSKANAALVLPKSRETFESDHWDDLRIICSWYFKKLKKAEVVPAGITNVYGLVEAIRDYFDEHRNIRWDALQNQPMNTRYVYPPARIILDEFPGITIDDQRKEQAKREQKIPVPQVAGTSIHVEDHDRTGEYDERFR